MAKLMLVEDDNNLREIYQARLQAEGYTIVAAQDGEEALVLAKAEKPELIISDVMMPKISGFEMLDILRNTEELKNVKVIMLTALGQSDDQQRADKLGADRYLVKSQVTLEDIVKVTHELLQDEPEANADPAATAALAATPDTTSPPTSPPADETPAAITPTEPASDISAASAAPAATSPSPEPPTTTAAPATAEAPAGAQSTAQEEANLEAKIEDFVAGATSEATTSELSPPTADALPVTEAPAAAPETTAEPLAPLDEARIEEALQSLSGSSDQSAVHVEPPQNAAITPMPVPAPEPPGAPPATTSPSADTPAAAPVVTPAPAPTSPAPAPTDTAVPAATSDAVTTITPETGSAASPEAPEPYKPQKSKPTTIAKKKIIQPLDLPGKKDIHTLLALEEVAEKAKQGPPPPTAIVSNDAASSAVIVEPPVLTTPESFPVTSPKISTAQSGNANAAGSSDVHIDPNSIAL